MRLFVHLSSGSSTIDLVFIARDTQSHAYTLQTDCKLAKQITRKVKSINMGGKVLVLIVCDCVWVCLLPFYVGTTCPLKAEVTNWKHSAVSLLLGRIRLTKFHHRNSPLVFLLCYYIEYWYSMYVCSKCRWPAQLSSLSCPAGLPVGQPMTSSLCSSGALPVSSQHHSDIQTSGPSVQCWWSGTRWTKQNYLLFSIVVPCLSACHVVNPSYSGKFAM